MKKIFRSVVTLGLIGAIFASCSSTDDSNYEDDNKKPENKLGGTYKKGDVLELDASIVYQLSEKLEMQDGSVLRIPAGTKIIGTGGTSSYIAIGQGAKIYAEGTKTNPIILTADIQKRGSWGGLVICGKAPINKGKTAIAEVSDLTYGGDIIDDNSGVVKYLRIEYAGANYNAEKEFNGLSMFGVGNGTTIEYVQTHEGSDDGFEWFGGTVNTKYLVSTNNDDDQFDWTEGWNGTNENWFSIQKGVADKGFEADNNSKDHNASPVSSPTIKNITLIGSPEAPVDGKPRTALHLRVGTKANIENIYLKNFQVGILVENDATIDHIGKGLQVKNVQFDQVEKKYTILDNNAQDVTNNNILVEGNNQGAGAGAKIPEWAKGWTVGLSD
ncbi:hypothetical protein ACYSNM_03325 [Myroides sp. LJL116]